jgi:hypothetical protein
MGGGGEQPDESQLELPVATTTIADYRSVGKADAMCRLFLFSLPCV